MKSAVKWALVFLLGAAIHYFLFAPVQELTALNLVSVAEPFFPTRLSLIIFSTLIVFGGRYLFFPFVIWMVYGLVHRPLETVLERIDFPDVITASPNLFARKIFNIRRRRYFLLRGCWKLVRRFYLVLFITLLSAQILVSAVMASSIVVHYRGAREYLEHCGSCHSYTHSLNVNLTREEWQLTVPRMASHSQATLSGISSAAQPELIELMTGLRGYSANMLLCSKCGRCHLPTRVFGQRKSTVEWELLIARIQRQRPFFINERQARQIVKRLTGDEGPQAADPWAAALPLADLSQKVLFERQCGLCHTLDIVLRQPPAADEWTEVLRRMGEKSTAFLSVGEAVGMLGYLRELPRDPNVFAQMFPHSRMREKP